MHQSTHQANLRDADPGSLKKLFDTSFCSMNYGLTADRPPWGISRFTSVNLHGVGVFLDEGYGPRTVVRTRRHILDDSVSDFIVVVPLVRHSCMSQAGMLKPCGPGHFRVLSTAVPFSGYVSVDGARDKYSELLVKVPGAMLRELMPRIDDISNVPIRLERGAGNIMKSMFELALAEGEFLSDPQSREFSATIVRAIAAAVADSAEYRTLGSAPPLTALQRLRNSAKDFILRNLSNPQLDGALVASHCRVSPRYLHAAFSPEETVSGFVREARLQKCRTALRNVELTGQTVGSIAASWGFVDPASFSRIYKARFGITPGNDRAAVSVPPSTVIGYGHERGA